MWTNLGSLKMPPSDSAVRTTLKIPYSEVAMHVGIAGKELIAIEEDTFYNGETIPEDARCGCYVMDEKGVRIPMLKSEAGWR